MMTGSKSGPLLIDVSFFAAELAVVDFRERVDDGGLIVVGGGIFSVTTTDRLEDLDGNSIGVCSPGGWMVDLSTFATSSD